MMALSVDWEPQGGALEGLCQWGVPLMIGAPAGCPQYIDFGKPRTY